MNTNFSLTFRIVHEQCCMAFIGDKLCEDGIKMGRSQGVCERPFFKGESWETKISKVPHHYLFKKSISLTFTLLPTLTNTDTTLSLFYVTTEWLFYLRKSCLRLDLVSFFTVSLFISYSDVLWLLHAGSHIRKPRFQLWASGFISGETVCVRCWNLQWQEHYRGNQTNC